MKKARTSILGNWQTMTQERVKNLTTFVEVSLHNFETKGVEPEPRSDHSSILILVRTLL